MDGLPLFLFAFVGYFGGMYWLSNIAERDMERRGRRGWALGSAVFFTTWISPLWLLAWWVARRRYPILEEADRHSRSKPRSS